MKLYENVVIGNFLYGLGYAVAAKKGGNEVLSVVNLLQQTPADKELGDVLLEYPGVVRLIEFKNKAGSLKKEMQRHSQLKSALGKGYANIFLSKSIHWYVETEPFNDLCVNNIKPYLDAFDGYVNDSFTLETFIEKIVDDVFSNDTTFSDDDFKNYLSLVARCQGTGEVGTGGIIIAVSESGIKYFQFTDIMQLRLQHKEYVNDIKNQFNKSIEAKKSINKTRSFNIGISR
ncbi:MULTISPECIES: hypothetical protein [Halomonas]|uniref:hypothetical protein n=1 Tax=Halomonas TaxID=2745 RepID=UPI001C978AF6|nr:MULTISPECIES: hypothetical protein [Halomonas]MBY6209380.1 hypothetical protein [Halomonas sp. DP3Y7-2]MBY6229535.1 hypothetical protein [Halomonas sp. DP3Y7-1]MCA0917406.1 hypothetical protein [Halomonas denitrificans]